jgi:hypothetical protein
MTSEGMLVRESVPWELRHVPPTECWIPGVVNFAVVTVLVAVVHSTLWKGYVVGDETEGGVGLRTILVALVNGYDGNRNVHRRLWNGCARGGFRPGFIV